MQPKALGRPVGADGPGRNITPNIVEKVISMGEKYSSTQNGLRRTIYKSGNVSVVVEEKSNLIITVLRNKIDK